MLCLSCLYTCGLLRKYSKDGLYILVVFLATFSLHYIVPVILMVLDSDYSNRYFYDTTDVDFVLMQISTLIFLFAVHLAGKFSGYRKIDTSIRYFETDVNIKNLKIILLIISSLAIVYQYNSFSFMRSLDTLTSRLQINSGKGYMNFLYVSSYFLVFAGIKQYVCHRISLKYLLLHAVPAFIIYGLALQRGHAVYPLFFIFVTYLFTHLSKKNAWRVLTIVVLLLYPVGTITSSIRNEIIYGTSFNITDAFLMENMVPDSFAHAELLEAMIGNEKLEYVFSTLIGTAVNWIPRTLFPDKPSSLGPVLNSQFTSDASYDVVLHNTSYTTDLLIEGYYHLGMVGVFLFAFIYCLLLCRVWNGIFKKTNTDMMYITYPLGLFLWGFVVFFSDLGNWGGYLVINYGLYYLISIFLKFRK